MHFPEDDSVNERIQYIVGQLFDFMETQDRRGDNVLIIARTLLFIKQYYPREYEVAEKLMVALESNDVEKMNELAIKNKDLMTLDVNF